MNYLSQNAAITANESLKEAIKELEKQIEYCGSLAHQDSKQTESAKAYFAKKLETLKADIESLKKLSSELSKRGWEAFNEEQLKEKQS